MTFQPVEIEGRKILIEVQAPSWGFGSRSTLSEAQHRRLIDDTMRDITKHLDGDTVIASIIPAKTERRCTHCQCSEEESGALDTDRASVGGGPVGFPWCCDLAQDDWKAANPGVPLEGVET